MNCMTSQSINCRSVAERGKTKKMSKRIVILFLLLLLLATAAQAKHICPLKCDCSEDFSVIKCRDMEKFPVFKFAKKVEILDLTYGQIKSIHEHKVREYPKLEKLFINHNPLTCNENNLYVLRHALREELGVKVFDGYKVKCKEKLHIVDSNRKETSHTLHFQASEAKPQHQTLCQQKGTCMASSGGVVWAILLTFIGLFCVAGSCWIIAYNRHRFFRMLSKHGAPILPLLQTEEGVKTATKSENSKTLMEGLKKQRRMSQGIPESDIVTSDEEDVVEKEQYIKEKLRKQRRRSQGYAAEGESSSEEETCVVEIDLTEENRPSRSQSPRRQAWK